MRIAVPYDAGMIFGHFGKTAQFMLYDTVENGEPVRTLLPVTNGGHGAIAGLLQANCVNAVICGGIGPGAIDALHAAGITVYPGIEATADAAVSMLLAGCLPMLPGANCGHHDHADGHGCGSDGGCGHHCG